MKKYVFMAVAAIAAFSSCGSDSLVDGPDNSKPLVFTATMERNDMRATLNTTTRTAEWEVNDKVSINGKTYVAETAGIATTFAPSTSADQLAADAAPYNAYFACNYDGTTATLPAAVETSHDKFDMPMYAVSNTTELDFKNLCGVLKINVKTDDGLANVKRIKVSSTNRALSGAFTVSGYAAVLTDASNVANTLTVTYTEAVQPTETGVDFYVAVPPATDYADLKIELAADGEDFTKSMTTTSTAPIVVERNKIYAIEYEHNGSAAPANAAKATIGGEEVYVEWVQLWEGGPKWAKYNLGVTKSDVTSKNEQAMGGFYMFGLPNRENEYDYYFANGAGGSVPSEYDNATNEWGSNWRMPTKAEFEALINNCDVAKVGTYDRKFTGKADGYTDKSIYLRYDGSTNGSTYWSATCYTSGFTSSFYMSWAGTSVPSIQSGGRFGIRQIRPVLKE